MDFDCIIIGGGSAGLLASKEIAKAGCSVCVIEEHQEIGYPVKCSGLFSISGLKELGIKPEPSFTTSTIKGGRFYSPSGTEILAYSDKERAHVVERKIFDKHLAREAIRAGAKIKLRTRMTGVKANKGISVSTEGIDGKETLKSHLLIGADGIGSNVARAFGIKTPKKVVACAQIEVESAEIDQDTAEMYFGREYAPNFYAWIMPKGDVYEVGVGSRSKEHTPLELLKKFIQKHPIASKKIKSESMLEVNIGGIPLGLPGDTVADYTMLVGDAASQVKSSTGGGVITGGIAARIAGRAAVKALEERDFSKEFLKREYEDKWIDEIGSELQAHFALREMFDNISDSDMDELFKIANEEGIPKLMVKFENTDRPSEFVKGLLKNERMLEKLQNFMDLKSLS
ncbi:NAD(P)/FAD-dependent oxidoreductase [archaeon]|nr:NAD(P)/FAD-dependent oxidoreductase [archaeon]